jgi:hypothetical protein
MISGCFSVKPRDSNSASASSNSCRRLPGLVSSLFVAIDAAVAAWERKNASSLRASA